MQYTVCICFIRLLLIQWDCIGLGIPDAPCLIGFKARYISAAFFGRLCPSISALNTIFNAVHKKQKSRCSYRLLFRNLTDSLVYVIFRRRG
jgi:hypothetical protein